MQIKPFELERYFAKYEFKVKYLLSSSDCDGLALAEVLKLADKQTAQLWENMKLGYTESLGLPLLREEVAALYSDITSDDVLIFVPEEAIFVAMNCLLTEGDHIICTYPGYQSLYQIAESLKCEVTKWEPREEDNWKFNPAFLKENIKPNTKLVVINFPHNPTGSLPSPEDFRKIIDIVQEHDVYLFSDEMYRFLELHPGDRLPSAVEVYDKGISLFGMSKTFGLAGLRLGWLVTRDKKLYRNMAEFKAYITICSSSLSEILALIALRAKDSIIEKHLKRINRNLGLLNEFFEKYQHLFNWVRPNAGTIGFPKILFDKSSFDFCEDVIKNTEVMILPSTVYDYDDRHFRIGFGRENMPEALARFEEYIQGLI